MAPVQIIEVICKPLADNPSLSVYIQMAEETLDRCFFGEMYDYAVAYKACHLFTAYSSDEESGGSSITELGGGAVSGIQEGGLRVDFAVPQGKATELSTTKYGRLLLDLMNSRPKMDVNRSPFFGGCLCR